MSQSQGREVIKTQEQVVPALRKILSKCELCVRRCGADRLKGEKGYCRAGAVAKVYSYAPHHGEEPPLSGTRGSGTIFFSHCPMGCVYCQNYEFSQRDAGREVSTRELADIMLKLQREACHNINFVSPTHFLPAIVEALFLARKDGMDLPVVYNTGGYDSPEAIRLLNGIIDIYLPDMKYSRDEMAVKYSCSPGYAENNRLIVKEMYKQAGNLVFDEEGLAKKGLMIRLLMLPGNISGTRETLEFIAASISKDVYLSVMSQYYPAYKALSCRELSRRINREEYRSVIEKMEELGLGNGWVQPFRGDFDRRFAGENFEPNV